MKIKFFLAAAFCLLGTDAIAMTHGVDVQVNEGEAVPSAQKLKMVLKSGDYVRDMLGWNHVDQSCNLATNPSATITIPTQMSQLYANVAAAGGRNFVTLGFNNVHCGQVSQSGGATFPNTPALRAEFAAYATQVVAKVPSLGGISIWNELNGGDDGHYSTIAAKESDYCKLVSAVVTAVRKVNPTLPIAIGATVGWNIDGYYEFLFSTAGCPGKADPKIWLDVHPYLSGKISPINGKTDFTLWNQKIHNIRAAGITNPLVATEWGAGSAYKWQTRFPGGNYVQEFEKQVIATDNNWAATMWFEAPFDARFPNAGLINNTGTAMTAIGTQYAAQYVH